MTMLKNNYNDLHQNAMNALTNILNNILSEYTNTINDNESIANLKYIQLHISHAIGELIEAKSHISELEPMELILKDAYEQEMDSMLKTMSQSIEFDDLLKEDN